MNSDTLIIIIIFASLGLLVFVFALSKLYRSLSATSNPLPPVQALAHHRQSYFQLRHFSKSDEELEYILVDPQPPFHHRPLSSCSTTNSLRPTPRPTSVASSSRLSHSPSLSPSSGRIGLPHSPHSQIHLVLPAPLSGSPSNSSIVATSEFGRVSPRPASSSRPSSRHFLDVSSEYDRRSISLVDRWLPPTDSHNDTSTPPRRAPSPLIPLSVSSSSSLSQAQSRRSIATTLRSPSDSPSNINISLDPTTDMGSGTTSNSSLTLPNPDQNPIPSAITADIPVPIPPSTPLEV